ncbi:MAG: orotidine-5'-phosphate decarboxylase [Propionibacteriaceae bacterium]
MTPLPFGARLTAAIAERGRLCVGIDPHPHLLASWGLEADVAGLETMARGLVEAVGPLVAALKPQSAFFEAYGSAGIAVLERVLADCAQVGALSVLDVKRGDIGSTMAAYAAAYLVDGAPLAADAITLSPYLGFGSLQPAVELATQTGRGLFVLAHTSNPEGPEIQLAQSRGRTVGQYVVDAAAALNAGVTPLGSIGIVVGATVGDIGTDFGALNGPVLAPGVGAQGGTLADLRAIFGADLPGVLPATSREIIAVGPEPAALREAVERTLDTLR